MQTRVEPKPSIHVPSLQLDRMRLEQLAPLATSRFGRQRRGEPFIFDLEYRRTDSVFTFTGIRHQQRLLTAGGVTATERRALNRYLRSCVWPDPS